MRRSSCAVSPCDLSGVGEWGWESGGGVGVGEWGGASVALRLLEKQPKT